MLPRPQRNTPPDSPEGSPEPGDAPPPAEATDACPLELKRAAHMVGVLLDQRARRLPGDESAVILPPPDEVAAVMEEAGLSIMLSPVVEPFPGQPASQTPRSLKDAGCVQRAIVPGEERSGIISCTGSIETGVFVNFDYVRDLSKNTFEPLIQSVSRVHYLAPEPYILACKQLDAEGKRQEARRFYPGRLAKERLFQSIKSEFTNLTASGTPTRNAAESAATRLQDRMIEIAEESKIVPHYNSNTLIPHVSSVLSTIQSEPMPGPGGRVPRAQWTAHTQLSAVYYLGPVIVELSVGRDRNTPRTYLKFAKRNLFTERVLDPAVSPDNLPVFTDDVD